MKHYVTNFLRKLLILTKNNSLITVIVLVAAVIFTVNSCSDEQTIMPRLTTLKANPDEITATSAILRGRITYLGNAKIIEYGIELSKSPLFSPSDTNCIKSAPDTGVFAIEFKDLEPSTLYYFKAYVLINTAQYYSQNVEKFTTKSQ